MLEAKFGDDLQRYSTSISVSVKKKKLQTHNFEKFFEPIKQEKSWFHPAN